MLKNKTKVLRSGKEIIIDSENLVLGDIMLLESGSKINADLYYILSAGIDTDHCS